MEDGNFWLPSEFLKEQDLSIDLKTGRIIENKLYSDLSSPDTVTETESDEEEYVSELSQKLARSALEDDLWNFENNNNKSVRVMAGSPQSTLCGCNHVSSRGSSNCPSPPPPLSQVDSSSSWDVLCAAAGEVARLRLAEDASFKRHLHRMSSQPPRRIPSPNSQFQQIQAAAQLKKQQQILLHQQKQYQQFVLQSRGINGGGYTKPVTAPLSAWPTLPQSQQQQQQPIGSGMRAVFLGNPNPKRECTGTGVFLPRQIGAPTEPRKKRGCSTVLLPDRVVNALNLNLEAQTRSSNVGIARHDYDAEMRYRNNVMMAEQRRQQAEMDLRLPQEWTY